MSLSHRGVLFLDEVAEFRRDVLEGLRQPLESGEVHIARANKSLRFPAKFQLVVAMNPCPCGYYGDEKKECLCTANEVLKYQKKISGPLMDRLDIQLNIPRIPVGELRNASYDNNEEDRLRSAVRGARKIQGDRFADTKLPIYNNAEMRSKDVDRVLELDSAAETTLKGALEKSFISARGYYRILKIAQTIADLDNSAVVGQSHIGEAFQYRLKDRG